MKVRRLIAIAAVIGVSAALVARADERKVKESEVPKPVIEAVKKKYPKAELVGFERETEKKADGETVEYEVNVRDGERKIDVDVSPEGKILAEEETISKDALPEKVKKGLAGSKYGKWDVKKTERIVTEEKEDAPSYELLVAREGERFEVVFDKDGKITKEEKKKSRDAKKDDDDDDDD